MKSEPPFEVEARAGQPLGMPEAQFVEHYWQRQALLIRGAFEPACLADIGRQELVDAATGDAVESRLLAAGEQRFGPFDATELPTRDAEDWILLVQDCDRLFEQARAVLDRFAFLPHWRVDDLMISYAALGGSAGPHVDQYDVFLVQGIGTKRWSIDTTNDPDLRVQADHPMGILAAFHPDRQWDLACGDALYLPPGVPHCGTALSPGTTWSVGFRAPSAAELWVEFAEYQLEHCDERERFRNAAPGNAITPDDLSRVRHLLGGLAATDDDELAGWFGRLVTRRELDLPPAGQSADRGPLALAPGVRIAWYAGTDCSWLFAAGEAFAVSPELAEFLGQRPLLSSAQRRRAEELGGSDLLRRLVRLGLWISDS